MLLFERHFPFALDATLIDMNVCTPYLCLRRRLRTSVMHKFGDTPVYLQTPQGWNIVQGNEVFTVPLTDQQLIFTHVLSVLCAHTFT